MRPAEAVLVCMLIAMVAVLLAQSRRARRERSAQEAEVRAREDLLGAASHELRTPLTTLRMQLEAAHRAARTRLDGAAAEDALVQGIAISLRQLDRLGRMVDDLLDYSRIRAGRLELVREEVDLAEIAREVVLRVPERARATIELSADQPVVGMWNGPKLDQIVTNLVSNALRYGDGKPVSVSIATDGTHARLTVRDHGVGIAEQDQARIFDRFERGPSGRACGGIGLGLFIVRELVLALGGTVRVESAGGRGSSFTVELPGVVATPGAAVEVAPATTGEVG